MQKEQEKVQVLMATVTGGVLRLNNLAGAPKKKSVNSTSSALKGGVSSVSKFESALEALDMVQDKLGFTVNARVLASAELRALLDPTTRTTTGMLTANELDDALGQFKRQGDNVLENLKRQVNRAFDAAEHKVSGLKRALEELSVAQKAKDQKMLETAIWKVMEYSHWGTEVDVPQLLVAVRELAKMAQMAVDEGYAGAVHVLDFLKDGMRRGPGIGGTTRWSTIGVYHGDIDVKVIASEMLRGMETGEAVTTDLTDDQKASLDE